MAQWWAEWNLNTGQVCPARGYPGRERRRPDQRNDETQSWELGVRSTQCLLHKSGWMCIFWLRNVLSPKSWCLNISVPTHAETGSLAVAIEQWMVSPRIAHHSPPPPQLWNVVEWSHSHRALHTSPSQISPRQSRVLISSELRLALGQSDLSFWWSHYLCQLSTSQPQSQPCP